VRFLVAGFVLAACLGVLPIRPSGIEFHPLADVSSTAPAGMTVTHTQALQELFGDVRAPQRWRQTPALTVLVSVMDYGAGGDRDYFATGQHLTEAEVDELVDDLTNGLSLLTANAFERFSSVNREIVPEGASTRVSRSNQIVVGRFSGLRRSVNKLGFGGRRANKDGTITAGAILLDSEFDRTRADRRLLRTHELGHALGYNHVHSRKSIMNPRIGAEPTEFDREAALIAFRALGNVASR
jgi:hypothetical protein